MNRSELRWMLDAVLPHVGTRDPFSAVGVELRAGKAHAYATDRYTYGIASVPDDSPVLSVHVPTREAKDVLRFVRPSLKAHDVEPVRLAVRDLELHVGLPDDSAVFDLCEPGYKLDDLYRMHERLTLAKEDSVIQVYAPDLFARFAKAGRAPDDRLRLTPCYVDERHGAAIVTMRDAFTGGIAGMTVEVPDAA